MFCAILKFLTPNLGIYIGRVGPWMDFKGDHIHLLLKGLYVEMKFQKSSKIQAISLPMILAPPFKDLIAQVHNGS